MVYKLIPEIENITFKNNKFLMQGYINIIINKFIEIDKMI